MIAGLDLYFIGAIITVLRARWYANLPFPLTWFALSFDHSYFACALAKRTPARSTMDSALAFFKAQPGQAMTEYATIICRSRS